MESLKITGSRITMFKASHRTHTVSHTMAFDESIWNRHEMNPKTEAYVELDKLSSPLFSAEDDGEVFFQIVLSKFCSDDKKADSASKSIYKINVNLESKPLPITVHYSSLYQSDLEGPFLSKDPSSPYSITVHPNIKTGTSVFYGDWAMKAGDKGFRVDTTYVKVTHQVHPQLTSVPSNNVILPKRCLGTDLLKDSASSDVTLKANGREWNLHKCVLKARSDKFAAMFANDLKEDKQGVVVIDDADTKAVDLMIKFIYTDTIDGCIYIDQSTTKELLILADKYDMPVLKEKCAGRLVSQLSAENCLQLCAFASNYNSELLLTASKKIIADNLGNFCSRNETVEFKDFVRDNSDLHLDILRIKLSNEK